MADAVDSKSTGENLVGSTPTSGTIFFALIPDMMPF